MKTLFFLAVIAAGVWYCLSRYKNVAKAEQAAAKADNQATKYVSSLQHDVQKAEDAQAKANAAVKQETEAVSKTLQDAEGKNQ